MRGAPTANARDEGLLNSRRSDTVLETNTGADHFDRRSMAKLTPLARAA
jgi:hypothetical protein